MRASLAAIVALVAAPAPAADSAADLLGWVPARANVALFVDVDALYQSEFARNNRWGPPDVLTTGLDSLPRGISRLVVASQFGPGTGPSWEVTVVAPKKPVTEADFAKRNDGVQETVGGRSVVRTPRHGYVVDLARGVAGAYTPPNRPDVGRWLREATGKPQAGSSEYLRAAAGRVGPGAPVVLAVDTTDMFDPAQVKAKLATAEALKGKADQAGAVAGLLAGLKGVTLTIRATDKLTGELRLDFSRPAAAFEAVGKPLVLEGLARVGVNSDDMNGWALAVKGETVTFGGPLSPDAADQFVAPFLRPGVATVEPDGPGTTSGDASEAKSKASLKYFKAVEKISNDTRAPKKESFEQLAFRFNNAARRIDDLPMLNVDDELLDWGATMATTFRSLGLAASCTGGTITLAEANKQMVSVTTPNYYYGSGYAGGVGYWGAYGAGYNYAAPTGAVGNSVSSNYSDINNMNAMTNQKEMSNRMQTWDTIKTATTTVRRKMVKKYGIEF